jgi:chloramphenicol-sensitive protein RarD
MNRDYAVGIGYAVLAYSLWGVLPLYWKQLEHLPSLEILAHRVIWSFVFVMLLLLGKGYGKQLKSLLSGRKVILALTLSALLISANWLIYIWAVNHDHVIEASLGYYMNPLVNVLLGMFFLKERLRPFQWVSIGLAFAGVLLLTVHYGKVPWIALSLALSFGFYGLAKKLAPVEALVGLTCETAILVPIALLYLADLQWKGAGTFGHVSSTVTLYLIFSGVATALPLLWFAQSARRISLTLLGFIQYLSPTISLLLGVFLFKEPFTSLHLLSFACIWGALAIYTWSGLSTMRAERRIQAETRA